MRGLLRAVLVVVLVLGAAFARAQSVSSSTAFDRFMMTATGAGNTTASFGSNGTPVASPGAFNAAPDGGAGFGVSTSGTYRNPAGNPVPASAKGRVPTAAAVGAIGRAAAKMAAGSFYVTAGMAMYDLARELGFWPSTETEPWRKDEKGCFAVTGCYYRTYTLPATDAPTMLESCTLYGKAVLGTGFGYVTVNDSGDPWGANGFCYVYRANGAYYNGVSIQRYGATSTQQTAVEEQAFLDAIAAQSGWPSSSAIARAAVEAAGITGEKLPVADPQVTSHPAQSDSKTTTRTSINADGSTRTETESCKFNHSTSGATVTTSEVCTTTVTNDGATGVTNTKTEEKSPSGTDQTKQEPKAECGIEGKPACNVKVDETGTPKPSEATADMNPQAEADKAYKDLKDLATDPQAKLPALPALQWAFALPTGCAPIDLGEAFAPYLTQIDVCQFVPVFHDLMSVVWTLGTIFGFISMFWRSTFSAN